jgi:hypothetical protein
MDTVFHCIIEPALSDRYDVIRGDYITRPGRITEQFVDDILTNDLIVCVLTGNNPNVYYELAIAESAARPIIVLRHSGDEIPFDVKDLRFIEYDLDPRKIFDKEYIKILQRYERELAISSNSEGIVPFAPHLTPLGRERLNFSAVQRYDLISSQVSEILAAARERFFFCGLSLKGWVANEGFISLLREKARSHVDCRALVMGPDNPAISQMLNRGVADQEARIRGDSKKTIEILTQNETDNLEIRAVSRGIIYQQMFMSENSMIWVPHLYSKQTGQSPALRINVTSSLGNQSGLEILYVAVRDEFEQLWYENARSPSAS